MSAYCSIILKRNYVMSNKVDQFKKNVKIARESNVISTEDLVKKTIKILKLDQKDSNYFLSLN